MSADKFFKRKYQDRTLIRTEQQENYSGKRDTKAICTDMP